MPLTDDQLFGYFAPMGRAHSLGDFFTRLGVPETEHARFRQALLDTYYPVGWLVAATKLFATRHPVARRRHQHVVTKKERTS